MCGIIGYVGPREAVPCSWGGSRRSSTAGTTPRASWSSPTARLDRVRAPGKLDNLLAKLEERTLSGSLGLGHTRWATHGAPNESNAHPHVDARERVAVIHNGIIENFLPLKRRLEGEGWRFSSDTDTEVVANLVSSHLEAAGSLREAVARAVAELEGCTPSPSSRARRGGAEPEIVAARKGPPLVLGLGEGEQFLGSDPAALLARTRDVIFLDNGDVARLDRGRRRDLGRAPASAVERRVQHLDWDPIQTEKGGYRHFMLKEIHEQPQAVQDTFAGRVDFARAARRARGRGHHARGAWRAIERVHLLACGTSWHAAWSASS